MTNDESPGLTQVLVSRLARFFACLSVCPRRLSFTATHSVQQAPNRMHPASNSGRNSTNDLPAKCGVRTDRRNEYGAIYYSNYTVLPAAHVEAKLMKNKSISKLQENKLLDLLTGVQKTYCRKMSFFLILTVRLSKNQ